MDSKNLLEEIKEFCKTTHGSTDYHKDEFFVRGEKEGEFAPLRYLLKKAEGLESKDQLLRQGYVQNSFELFGLEDFRPWYESQFSRKMTKKIERGISILEIPNNKAIFDVVETIDRCFTTLRDENIILNGKNLPVQLGEWYAKCIFGLKQVKSASQRGFDLFLNDKRVEVKISWSDIPSPKGSKIRKSMVELSDYTIIIYLGRNFMIREICFLDSDFVMRKFAGKGHTIFLKDTDVSSYFFSKSDKHLDKVMNSTALLKYSNPTLAMNLAEGLSNK